MFPSYRSSAAQRRHTLLANLILFGTAVFVLAAWSGLGYAAYVAWHFVNKFW